MKKKYVILLVVVAFLSGGAAGHFLHGFMMFRHFHHAMEPGNREMADFMIRRLSRGLDLTDDQKKDVTAIIYAMHDEIEKVRSQEFPAIKAAFTKAHDEIAAKLTPEQKAKFEEMHQKFMRHMEKHFPSPPPNP